MSTDNFLKATDPLLSKQGKIVARWMLGGFRTLTLAGIGYIGVEQQRSSNAYEAEARRNQETIVRLEKTVQDMQQQVYDMRRMMLARFPARQQTPQP